MSAALVPGRILRLESSSASANSCSPALPNDSPTLGDFGPIWTSVKGGGLGRRGELDGETPAAVMAVTLVVAGVFTEERTGEEGNKGGSEGQRGWSKSTSTSTSRSSPSGASKRHQSIAALSPNSCPFWDGSLGLFRQLVRCNFDDRQLVCLSRQGILFFVSFLFPYFASLTVVACSKWMTTRRLQSWSM